jgi:hypothetical protein
VGPSNHECDDVFVAKRNAYRAVDAAHDVERWTVTDDWPERVPVTKKELDVFEAWFGDPFDEQFGPRL